MPFEDRGVGFQDAVILLSTTEDLMRLPTESGILLSDDEIFSKGETRDIIARLGVDLKVYRSVADFIVFLKSNLEDYLRQEWDEDEGIAKAALLRQKDRIEKSVLEIFSQDPRLLSQYVDGQDVIAVKRVELQEVTAVFVARQPQSHENRTTEQPVPIAAEIRCLIQVELPWPSISNKFHKSLELRMIPIEIEAEATRSERRYTIAKCLSAKPTYEPELWPYRRPPVTLTQRKIHGESTAQIRYSKYDRTLS